MKALKVILFLGILTLPVALVWVVMDMFFNFLDLIILVKGGSSSYG